MTSGTGLLPMARLAISVTAFVFILLVPMAGYAAAQDWKPIDPSQLALHQPKIQADADAETLL
jgi:hypothetical protein